MKTIASFLVALVCFFTMCCANASPLTYDDLLADAGDTPVAIASEAYVSMDVDGEHRMFGDVDTSTMISALTQAEQRDITIQVTANLAIPEYDLNGPGFDEMESLHLIARLMPIDILPKILCIGVDQPETAGTASGEMFKLSVDYLDYSYRYNRDIYDNHSATKFGVTNADSGFVLANPSGSSFLIIIDQVSSDGRTLSGRFAGRLVYEYDSDKSVRITNGKFSFCNRDKVN